MSDSFGKMSLRNCVCIVCHFVAASVTELHRHQTCFHTVEELSMSIINFQNLAEAEDCSFVTNDKQFSNKENVENHNHKNISSDINKDINYNSQRTRFTDFEEQTNINNEENLNKYSQQIKSEESMNLYKTVNETKNQDIFQLWKVELSKPYDIVDDDFFLSIDNLCEDLKNPKCRAPKRLTIKKEVVLTKHSRKNKRGRPRKVKSIEMNVNIKTEPSEDNAQNIQVSETQDAEIKEEVSNVLEACIKKELLSIPNETSNVHPYLFSDEDIFQLLGHVSKDSVFVH